jgi:glycosyltransferase involved in cell wall biosynthesis
MVKMKISAVVITKNEEQNIRECLESIKWADEIVVVDSGSTDRTREISSSYTKKVFNVLSENIAEKRILSLNNCSFDWVLMVDSDERITRDLREEIMKLDPQIDPPVKGYYINRRNYYLGKWIKNCGLYPDYHLRLFRRSEARVINRPAHEAIEVRGKTEKLKNDMLHFSYRDLHQMIQKINFYSTHEAVEHFLKQKQITKIGVFTHAISAFLRVYVSRKGYKDNLPGFYVSFTNVFTNFLTHLKLLRLQNKL